MKADVVEVDGEPEGPREVADLAELLEVELALATIATLSENRPAGMQFELFAYGRLPLAFSARCFTARKYRRAKDECEFICRQHPDGLTLYSREDQPFLTLNGIQTQSAAQQCLIGDGAAIRAAGASRVRLSPVAQHFDIVLACFERVLNGDGDAAAARVELEAECSRCLAPFGYLADVAFEEVYAQQVEPATGRKLPLEDPDSFLIGTDHTIDIREAVRQYGQMAAEMQPLCRPDCPGICPVCGTDLGIANCQCDRTPIDPRWQSLVALKRKTNG